jgi:hypothetical protein
MLFILILFFLLIVVPIPIKVKVKYNDMKLDFYVYNINLNDKIRFIKKRTKRIVDTKPDRIHAFINTLQTSSYLTRKLKFKPALKIKLDLLYGLDDAAYTALLHGVITSFYPILIQFVNLFFKVKESNIKIQPEFNKFIVNLEIDSIISVNLVKVIYISFISYRHLRKSKNENLANT